ncbi:MAG: hypothetical protein ACRDY0_03990 [Acidimicrobiales bacterium]
MRTMLRALRARRPAAWCRRLGLLVLGAAWVLAACGGSGQGSTGDGKSAWVAQHGASVAALSRQLDFARSAISGGQRDVILGSCGLLQDDVTAARGAVPLPDAAVDRALSTALSNVRTAAADCLTSARVASNARLVERAMAELATARTSMNAADASIAAWR